MIYASRPDDVVIMAVKSDATIGVIDALARVAPPTIHIVCAQNGVENERVALRSFANVQAMCVMMPAEHLEPGVVVAYSSPIPGLLDVGRFPGGTDDTTEAIAAALTGAGFESIARPDVMRWKYAKLLMNLGNVIEAASGTEGRGLELASAARREARACYEAAGIDFASGEEDRERRGDKIAIGEIDGALRGGGSTWQSLARSTGRIETDFLNGEIVLLGRLHGVATPVNERLAAPRPRARGRRRRRPARSTPTTSPPASPPDPPSRTCVGNPFLRADYPRKFGGGGPLQCPSPPAVRRWSARVRRRG